MYHPEYGRALELLQKIHQSYRLTIDTKIKDVRLAVYYLSGGCITQANLSLKAWAMGDLNTPYRVKRFIDEASMLITCMIIVSDRERFVNRFFEDEIVTINPKKYKNEIMETLAMDEPAFEEWIAKGGELSHGFSKGVHPNFRAVAYNSDINTGEFDYNVKNFAYYPIDGFDFANFIVIPAIDSVINPSELFGVGGDDLKEIYSLREKIQQIAIEYHKKRKEGIYGN